MIMLQVLFNNVFVLSLKTRVCSFLIGISVRYQQSFIPDDKVSDLFRLFLFIQQHTVILITLIPTCLGASFILAMNSVIIGTMYPQFLLTSLLCLSTSFSIPAVCSNPVVYHNRKNSSKPKVYTWLVWNVVICTLLLYSPIWSSSAYAIILPVPLWTSEQQIASLFQFATSAWSLQACALIVPHAKYVSVNLSSASELEFWQVGFQFYLSVPWDLTITLLVIIFVNHFLQSFSW